MTGGAPAPPELTMPYEPDYDPEPDFEAEDHRMAEAEDFAERVDGPGYRSCRPQPCPQCNALWPVVDALVARDHAAILETQMGGGVHAVRVWLDDGGWVLANEECFSFYHDEDDDDGYGHTFYSTDDPPNAEQQAILINLAIDHLFPKGGGVT